MEERATVGWGFELQRYRIIKKENLLMPPGVSIGRTGACRYSPEGDLWVPNSRLITGPNIVIDLAQQELLKIWRAIQGSVRQIEQIAVGDGLTVPLDTDVALENELDSKDITIWDDTDIVPDSIGVSTIKAQVVWLSLEAIGVISEIGLKFDDGSLVTHALFKKLSISDITQANPAVVTTGANHGLVTGDEVHIDNVVGMTEVNDRDFSIVVLDADEFELVGEDSTGHTAYSSAGDAWLVVTKTSGEVLQTNYVITMAA